MAVKFAPYWHCKDCFVRGNAKISIPSECPKCGSKNIHIPPIKKGGPFNIDSLKKY